jgi:hypothetical protein
MNNFSLLAANRHTWRSSSLRWSSALALPRRVSDGSGTADATVVTRATSASGHTST